MATDNSKHRTTIRGRGRGGQEPGARVFHLFMTILEKDWHREKTALL